MALVTQNTSANFESLLAPFTGVNNATARLLKAITAQELAMLREGDVVYVMSVRDYWKWLPNSTLTDDTATEVTICAPTVVGVGAGRFERLNLASPDWMIIYQGASVSCVIDAAVSLGTTSNENDGLTAATALRTVFERQRRMGTIGRSTGGTYHIRYISNVPAAQTEVIRIDLSNGAQAFVHGSMTDGAGQSTIFGGTSGTITALNYAAAGGGQPWEMICATIPVSWTASGCVNKRFRWTNGANNNRIIWGILDLGGAAPNAKIRLNEGQVNVAMTNPVTPSANTYTPVAGDTFVVETLTNIPNLAIDCVGGATSSVSSNNGVILDSLDLTGGRLDFSGSRQVTAYGCSLGLMFTGNSFVQFRPYGCQFTSNVVTSFYAITMSNCYATTNVAFHVHIAGSLVRFMGQGGSLTLISANTQAITTFFTGWQINQIGIWNIISTTRPLTIVGNATLASTATLWGNGNTANSIAPIALYRGAVFGYAANSTALPASYFYLLSGIAGVENGAFIACYNNASTPRVNVPAYDDTTQLFTANRLLSPANLQATVAAGGFGGYFLDPVTSCSMGQV